MSVTYICRHCHTPMGSIERHRVDEHKLGFQLLTAEERNDIITYNVNGDVVVRMTCDFCHQAYTDNPELMLVHSPLQ